MTTVRGGSRLHFGLFRLSPEPWPEDGLDRYFGGAGLMIAEPAVEVRVERANEWSATGPSAERALAFARSCGTPPMRVEVIASPPPHAGFGSGTQLALATARAVTAEVGSSPPVEELARRTGRGRRSAIGVHGFAHGGFLVEGGKRKPDALSPLVARQAWPDEWRIALISSEHPGWSGENERQAFSTLGRRTDDAMARLIWFGMLPALVERDLRAFGEALYEYNSRAGEHFRSVQGGTYASPKVTAVIDTLRQAGVVGVGQSSWGPTVFAVVAEDEIDRIPTSLGPVQWTTAANQPSQLGVGHG